MTTNAKYNRYVELCESIGLFINALDKLLTEAFRPAFRWGERYWKARTSHGGHLPA